jgi:hypothetical protein
VQLPKVEQQASQWQTAAEVLMLIGEHGGDPMMAHIAMMRALRRHEPKAAPACTAPETRESLSDGSMTKTAMAY